MNAHFAQQFFKEIVSKLLEGYIDIILDKFTNSNGIDIGISEQVLSSIYSCTSIKFDSQIVNPVWKFNSIGDLKIYIGFCFTLVYNFYWNKIL